MRRFASVATGLFACVAGCGDDGGARKLPDAPLVEDGPAPDMLASGTVNITTMARCCTQTPNTPHPNILVVAVNPDGGVVTAMTDADGKASLSIREGATVTAVYPEDEEHENDIRTYVGVKPDDNLTFGDAYYTPSPSIAGAEGQMIVNWPAVAGAVRYLVYMPCMSTGYVTGLTAAMSLYTYCQTATSPMMLLAFDNDYEMIASAYLPAAASTVGATVNVTADQWVTQDINNAVVSITGLDPVVQSVRLEGRGDFVGYNSWDDSEYVDVKAGAASAMLTVPSTAPRKYGRASLYRNGNFGEQNYYKGGQPPFALQHTSLPWIDGRSLVSFQQRRAVWFETSGSYDAAVLYLDWYRSENKQDHYYNWTIILPPNVADFRFPAPPPELEPYLPNAKDGVDHHLMLVDLSSTSSYDAARALPEWRVTNPEAAVIYGDEPSAGITGDGEGFSFAD